MKLSSDCFSNVYNNFSLLLWLRLSTRRYRKLQNQQKKEVSFLVIGRYSKDSYYSKCILHLTFVKNAHFFHHAYETENKNRAPVDRERVGRSAGEILSKVVYGKKAHP